MDDLRTALQTLTADQPQNGQRSVEVRGRIRRRARQRAAAVGALSVVALVGAAAVVLPGPESGRESLPGRAVEGDGVQRSSLDWEPRGKLLDRADEAVDDWSRGGTVRGVEVLYAGSPVDVVTGRPSTEHWYAWQATRDGLLRLVVARDRDGDGPQAPEVLADQPAGPDDRRAVSLVVTEADGATDGAVWPGKPGTIVRDTLFVLPHPQARSVTRLLDSEPELNVVETGADSMPVEPSVWTYDASTVPVRLSVDGQPTPAGLPLVAFDPRVVLAPPALPVGWVLIGGGNGGQGGRELGVPVQVLVRCTSAGGPLSITYDTASTSTTTQVRCDGRSVSPFGEIEPVPSGGVSQPGVAEGEYRVNVDPQPGAVQFQVWLAIRRIDATSLGLAGIDESGTPVTG